MIEAKDVRDGAGRLADIARDSVFRPIGMSAARGLRSGDRIISRTGARCEVVAGVPRESPADARLMVRPLTQVQARNPGRDFSMTVSAAARWGRDA